MSGSGTEAGRAYLLADFSSAEIGQEAQVFDRNVNIYIDSDMGDGACGEVEAQHIANLEFKKIFSTSYEKIEIRQIILGWKKRTEKKFSLGRLV